MRKGVLWITGGLVVVGGLALGAAVLLGGNHRSGPPAHLTWLAAGDSYSSGEGLAGATGPSAQATPPTSQTWAQAAASSSGIAPPTLVACTGAISDQFFNPSGSNTAEWTPARGRFDLVTFTFGGDDVGFAPTLEQCLGLTETEPSNPGHTCPADALIQTRIAGLRARYVVFLNAVAEQVAEPGGNIVVLGYPDLVEMPALWSGVSRDLGACDGIRISDATLIRAWADDLNSTIATAVATFSKQPAAARSNVSATFVAVDDAFEPATGARHNLCASTPWLNGITIRDFGRGSFHPNQLGQDGMGELAAQAIKRLVWSRLAGVDGHAHPCRGSG